MQKFFKWFFVFQKIEKIPNNERSITHLFTITDIVATILIYINKNNNNDSIIIIYCIKENDNNMIIEEKNLKFEYIMQTKLSITKSYNSLSLSK